MLGNEIAAQKTSAGRGAGPATVEQAGAQVVQPKSPIPSIGYYAIFRDPEGNFVGLFQSDESVTTG